MLFHFSVQDESEGDAGSDHQQESIYQPSNTERTWRAHSLFEVLDIRAQRGDDEGARDINPSHYTVQLGITAAQAVRKLHRAQQKRTATCKTMRQQPPPKRMIMVPYRVVWVDDKALVVRYDVCHHQDNESKYQVLAAY